MSSGYITTAFGMFIMPFYFLSNYSDKILSILAFATFVIILTNTIFLTVFSDRFIKGNISSEYLKYYLIMSSLILGKIICFSVLLNINNIPGLKMIFKIVIGIAIIINTVFLVNQYDNLSSFTTDG